MSNLRFFSNLAAAMGCLAAAYAQPSSLSCTATAVPTLVRTEGVAERVGDIVLSCSGPPNTALAGNLTVSLNTVITNHILSNGSLDVALSVNGANAGIPAQLAANNQITFSGIRVSSNGAGSLELRISNIRADASFGGTATTSVPTIGLPFPSQPIVAQLAFNPGGVLNFANSSNYQVAVSQRGLYATSLSAIVPSQFGSQLPDTVTFANLLSTGTFFSSTRVSEGSLSAWQPRQSGDDTGTRIMLRFSGYPSDARLFVPAAIAGSDAQIATQAGDFGGTPTGGVYVPGSNTLLLVRVIGTDLNGAGGYLASGGASIGTTGAFDTMTEVSLTNGSGVAVFEVVDANSAATESAQIPVFIGVPRSTIARNITLGVQTSLAPISTTAIASTVASIPRFVNLAAPTDCSQFQDCGKYVPKLGAPPINTQFRLVQGVGSEERVIPLTNQGGGLMPWTATIEYKSGNNWILLDRTSELQAVPIRMVVRALTELQPGTYEATVVIDAGPAGVARYPVTLQVLPVPPPVTPTPQITSVVHGATFQTGSVVRGEFVTIKGNNLSGNSASVTFDGKAGRLVYTSATQLNVQVPVDLAGSTTQMVVSIGGTASSPVTLNVAPANPGIFDPGIVNQDGSVNSGSNPANSGTYVQIYATGLLPPDGSGTVEARLNNQPVTEMPYAGPAPGLSGLQQVNIRIPIGYASTTTDLVLCSTVAGTRACSPAVKISIRQAQ